jgi:hypothetical protein
MSGWFRTFWIVPAFVKMPIIGGIKIIAKNMMMADRYSVYFKGFFEDQEFNICESLLGTLMLLFFRVSLLKRKSK